MLSLPASAQEEPDISVGGINYNIEDSEAVVVGIADEEATTIRIPGTIQYQGKTVLVTKVGRGGVAGVSSLETFEFGPNLRELGYYAISTCSNLKKVIMPPALIEIGEYVFYNCKSLAAIEGGAGVRKIDEYAFYGCVSLPNTVTFGPALQELNASAFFGLSNIKAFAVDAANPNFTASDGVLFSKDMTELAIYPCGRPGSSYTVPALVSKICYQAIRNVRWLTSLTLPEGLETIDDRAMAGCHFSYLNIPASVREIGDGFIYGCSSLTSLTIAPGNTAYEILNGNMIRGIADGKLVGVLPSAASGEVVIPDGTREIGEYTFYSTNLTGLRLPASVRIVGRSAFNGCSRLVSADLGDGLQEIGENAFRENGALKSVRFGRSLKKLGSWSFADCAKLEEAILPDGLESIEDAIFFDCYALTKARVPGTVKEWKNSMFYECSALTECELGEGLTEIPLMTFQDCESMTEIKLPSTLKTVGCSAFYNVPITSIQLPAGLKMIDETAFYGTQLEEINIPDQVETIGNFAFAWCMQMRTARLGKKVKELGDYALQVLPSLTSITLNEGLEKMGIWCVALCENLRSITFPSTLREMGEDVCICCPFEEIVAKMTVPPTLTGEPFCGDEGADIYGSCVLHVPAGSLDSYNNAAFWKNFKHKVGDVSGIGTFTTGGAATATDVYGIDGKRQSPMRRGISIVRYSDGRVEKVYRK